LQSATYADKSTHYLFGYDLSKKVNINGDRICLADIVTDIMNGKSDSSQLIELIRKLRADRINAIVQNIVNDYQKVFRDRYTFKTIDDVANFLQGKNYKDVVKAFDEAGIKFYEEFHGTKPKYNGAPKIALNETMLNYYRTFNDPKLFEQRIAKARDSFIKTIDENY
jgi:hypothetical protein